MPMQLLVGGLAALSVCSWSGAIVALAAWMGHRRRVNLVLAAIVLLCFGLHCAGLGAVYWGGHEGAVRTWAAGTALSRGSGVVMLAGCAHLALRRARLGHQLRIAVGLYTVAGVLALGMVSDFLRFSGPVVTGPLSVFGFDLMSRWGVPTAAAKVLMVANLLMSCATCALLAVSYLRGRRDALALFVGAGVVAVTVVNDTLLGWGVVRTVPMMPLGFVCVICVVQASFLRSHAALRNQLSRNISDTRLRTRQLGRARRELSEIETKLGRTHDVAVIGEMGAVIAHEVRNPLAVVSNAVSSLRREELCQHDREALLNILDEETLRLNRLVPSLLSYGRPVSVQRERVVLYDLVQHVTSLGSNRSKTRFVLHDTGVRGQIWGDSSLLRQVFDNIVENAIQAMGGEGAVTIAINSAAHDGVNGYTVSIRDEGEGMDTQVRQRAADPFFTTRAAGTGLGLAIVNRIVRAHDGDVDITSRSGAGTTVAVFLPIGRESLPGEHARESRPDPADSQPFLAFLGKSAS